MKTIISLIFGVFVFLAMLQVWAEAASWNAFYRYPTGSVMYYDKANIERRENNVRTSLKYVVSIADKRSFVLKYFNVKNINSINHVIYEYELACNTRMYEIVGYKFIGKDGNTLKAGEPRKNKFLPPNYVMPDSYTQKLYDEMCIHKDSRIDGTSN